MRIIPSSVDLLIDAMMPTSRMAAINRGTVRRLASALCLATVMLASGCATIGTMTIRPDRFRYNEAGAESNNEQLLLNLVRLRYGEPVYFLDIGSMLSQRVFDVGADLAGVRNNLDTYGPALRSTYGLNGERSTKETSWSANLKMSDRPTITYTPVQGERFAQQFMTPIPPSTIIYLSQSGWSIDRLLECCVQKINGLANVAIHDSDGGGTEDVSRFRRVAKLMKVLQDTQRLNVGVEADTKRRELYFVLDTHAESAPETRVELFELLGLRPEAQNGRIRLIEAAVPQLPTDFAIQTRSLLAMMYALAEGIDAPPEHEEERQVSSAKVEAPGLDESRGRWLNVQFSRTPQVDAFAQVSYNGYWFYIAKSDWSSKRTFALMTYLLSLQASPNVNGTPLVTVQAGS